MLNRLLGSLQTMDKHDQRMMAGATAMEYALIAAFVALVIVTALTSMGLQLESTFNEVGNSF